ncbi:hypothetical protein KPH14_011749 [Odynerus spinipes]|uniref:Caspase-1 n=1 Tax=Odynerus spinipes TaxID=1348599 RepID=A0AAD9VTZ5_9HYME|nr:hypothetical protein KPH14_011749 [Odynerus spinipes]
MHFHDHQLSKNERLSKEISTDNAGNEVLTDQDRLNSSDIMGNNNTDSISTSRSPDVLDAYKYKVADGEYRTPNLTTATMVISKDATRYNMNHKNRGKCVIFNHEKFDTDIDKREGTDVDAKRIHTVFSKLDFDVLRYDDLTYTEIRDTIITLSNENHSNNDCICIFVLTHGHSHDLLYAKDVPYKSDYIWKRFTADVCTSLAGKPKLFFFQACRGEEWQEPVELRSNSEITVTDSVASYNIPTHADFLIAHSTAQGFYSFRNGQKGSCYVQYLCNTIEEYASTKDLISILTITARKVATEFISNNDRNLASHNKKQIPSVTSMLIRDLYFTPKQRNTNQETRNDIMNKE